MFGSFFSKKNIVDGLKTFNMAVALTAMMQMLLNDDEEMAYSEECMRIVTYLYTHYSLDNEQSMVGELLMNTFGSGNAYAKLIRTGSESSMFDFLLHMSNVIGIFAKNPGSATENSETNKINW